MLTCKKLCGLTAIIAALIIFVIACSDDESAPTQPSTPGDNIADCIGCHTNGDMLEATAIEDTSSSSSSGEG